MPRLRAPGIVLSGLVALSTLLASAGAMGQYLDGAARRVRSVTSATDDSSILADARNRVERNWRQDVSDAIRRRKRVDLGRNRKNKNRPGGVAAPVPFTGQNVYFPSGNPDDARFLILAGSDGTSTLTNEIRVKLATRATETTLNLAVYDPDLGGTWDNGSGTMTYTLYKDPLADGSGVDDINNKLDQWTVTSDPSLNDTWAAFTANGTFNGGAAIPISSAPATPSGNRFFVLRIQLSNASRGTLSAFKLRTSASVRLEPQDAFSFIGQLNTTAEAQRIYPDYPSLARTTYDGTWDFFSYVPISLEYKPSDPTKPTGFEVWDGDFDYGSYINGTADTDDPNTTTLPSFALNSSANPEGVSVGYNGATGNPPDDYVLDLYRRSFSATNPNRSGLVYDVTDPAGVRYYNTNPSGNLEWERFRIETNPNTKNNPLVADAASPGSYLPAGVYQLHIDGLDLGNLCSIRFQYDVLGVDQYGNPVKPLLPYNVGDTVFTDTTNNGVFDGADTGIQNVKLSLLDENNNVIDTTTTGALQGSAPYNYAFNVDSGTYKVRVEPSNFSGGGALAGLHSTTGGETQTYTVTTGNVYSYDFGYSAPGNGTIGDRVWLDLDADGVQDPGEPGIGGVTVTLTGGGDTKTTTTDSNGFYLFSDVSYAADTTYTITVSGAQLDNLTPTYDSNDQSGTITTPLVSTVTLGPTANGGAARTSDLNQDFGFVGSGSIGDMVWNDVSANGVYNPGIDVGLANVRVWMTWDADGDGSVDMYLATTTDKNGYYLFTNLPPAVAPGKYTVHVDPNTLPYGMSLVADPDGTDTPSYASLTLAPGASNLDQDFGYRGEGAIGDTVWKDTNANRVQDSGEAGIANVTLTLTADFNLDGLTDYTATTKTDANGKYLFSGLPAGRYSVTVNNGPGTAVNGWTPTYDYDDTNGTISTPHTAIVALPPRYSNLNVDFGYTGSITDPGSIGDYVWLDSNGDGVQDSSESGLAGVSVALYSGSYPSSTQVGSTQTTGSNGAYLFSNLAAGTYYVRFTLPSGYSFSPKANSSAVASGSDSDADTTLTGNSLIGVSSAVNLASGSNITSVDAGAFRSGSVGDFVWIDANQDGIQTAGETGLAGVVVKLFKSDNTLVSTAPTTTSSGAYSFTGLAPGNYYVQFDLTGTASSYGFSPKLVGNDRSKDSDADTSLTGNPRIGRTATFTLASGQNRTDIDAGAYQAGTIGDLVWLDDGTTPNVKDANDHPLPGALVQLFDATSSKQVGSTQTTGADGKYLFTGVSAGTYYVQFTLPNGYKFVTKGTTQPVPGTATDSDADPLTGRTGTFTLATGQAQLDVDAGALPATANTNSVGDYVWVDSNGNGVQDSSEAGLGGVTVTLHHGASTTTTTTAADGSYIFSNVVDDASPSAFYITFTLPSGYVFSPKANSNVAASATDSDADTVTGKTATFSLSNGQHLTTVDAGMYQPCSIGDIVWLDINGNGVQDFTDDNGNADHTEATDGNGHWDPGEPGEPGLAGVKVDLYTAAGVRVGSQLTTTSSGLYSFANLAPGSYYVQFTLPAGYAFSKPLQGGNVALDSDADTTGTGNPLIGRSATLNLSGGQTLNTVDAGAYQTATLGDFIWEDLNKDGIQNVGEPGLAGAVAKLYTGSGTLVATSPATGSSGAYSFTGLAPGSYYVTFTLPANYKFSANDQGTNDALDSDANPTSGQTATYTLTSGQVNNTVDAGASNVPSGAIGDNIWLDANRDGIFSGESLFTGTVTVKLFDGAGTALQSVTTSNGSYMFTGLDAGSYYVQFILPANYYFSAPSQGSDPTKDSDPDPGTGKTAIFTLGRGQTRTDIDAGVNTAATTASVGDFVWLDWNGNGIQDFADTNGNGIKDAGEAAEPGLSGAKVKLFNASTNAQVQTEKTTDATGAYSFTGLPAGSYYVQFTLPSGYSFTSKLQGSDPAKDSDADPATGKTATFNLGNGQALTTIDAGAYMSACLGGTLWFDQNRDGIFQVATESKLAGVTVKLTSPTGVSKTTVTGSDGYYVFQGLAPGSYTVTVVASTIPTSVIPAASLFRTYDYDGFTTSPDVATYDLQQSENCASMNFGYATAPYVAGTTNWTTFTIGGWGAVPKGGNPGGKLHTYWSGSVVGGALTLGLAAGSGGGPNNEWVQLRFTGPQAVTDYLPDGGTPTKLTWNLAGVSGRTGTVASHTIDVRTNPFTTEAGVLASQALAVKLSVLYCDSGALPKKNGIFLKNLVYTDASSAAYNGKTVSFILDDAEKIIGGKKTPSTGGYPELNRVLTNINENFDNGTVDKGYLR